MSKESDTVTYPMKFPRELLVDLDSLRKGEDDLPSRAEMVRRLIYRACKKAVRPMARGRPRRSEDIRP